MPIDREKVRNIVRYNRRDISGLRETLDRKLISFIGWLYRNLELGPAWERGLQTRLAGRTVPEIVGALRPVVGRLSDAVRAGRASARGYASMIVREYDSAREIEDLDTKLPKIKDDSEYFKAAVFLKSEVEVPFLEDLLRHLLSYLPTDRRGIAEAERVLGRVRKRLEDLLRMVGTLTGHVYDADTKESIEGAETELVPLAGGAALSAVTDKEGHYTIDLIPPGDYRALCRAEGYEEAEDTLTIEAGKVRTKDWFLRKVVVPKVWSYALRVSCRVLRGYAMGRTRNRRPDPNWPPRWVELTIEEAEELARLPEKERRRAIMDRLDELVDRKTKVQKVKKLRDLGLEKSPIFVELFFESFLSSLPEEKLEDAYREEFIRLVEAHRDEIARMLWYNRVELAEWDFGIEAKEPSEYAGEKSSDKWEIYVYPPSGYAQFIGAGYYEHDVGEKEAK